MGDFARGAPPDEAGRPGGAGTAPTLAPEDESLGLVLQDCAGMEVTMDQSSTAASEVAAS